MVSAHWGGARNPDGSCKRTKLPADQAKAREKQAAKTRAERKAQVKQRFLEHRKECEGRKDYTGPRKFEEWLLALAEAELEYGGNVFKVMDLFEQLAEKNQSMIGFLDRACEIIEAQRAGAT